MTSPRRTGVDAGHWEETRDEGVSGLALFDTDPRPAWVQTWGTTSPEQRRAIRESWEAKLEPIALELTERRGPEGITASELTTEGILRGVLWGERSFLSVPANRRIYSFVGPMLARMASAKKIAEKRKALVGGGYVVDSRPSERPGSKRNPNDVYVAVRFAA